MATGGRDRRLRVFDVRTLGLMPPLSPPPPSPPPPPPPPSPLPATAVDLRAAKLLVNNLGGLNIDRDDLGAVASLVPQAMLTLTLTLTLTLILAPTLTLTLTQTLTLTLP